MTRRPLARTARYRSGPAVKWTVETTGIRVWGSIDSKFLDYPEAAIWDFLSRGYDETKILRLLAPIANLDAAACRRLLDQTLQIWAAQGLLLTDEGSNG